MKKNSETPKFCEFCRYAEVLSGTEDMLCKHKGAVDREYSCRRFIYDPLKRVPRKLPELIIPEELL
ncbi:MAG: hypothetical protein IJY93_09165 [Clostridia bacterium]|nr:hypothetical protein [Clostridia bacterium]